MNVWILSGEVYYEGSDNLGIFDSLPAAEEAMAKVKKALAEDTNNYGPSYDRVSIDKVELNKLDIWGI